MKWRKASISSSLRTCQQIFDIFNFEIIAYSYPICETVLLIAFNLNLTSPQQNALKCIHHTLNTTPQNIFYLTQIGYSMSPHNCLRKQQKHTANHSLNFILVTCFLENQFYESIVPGVVKTYGILSEYTEWKTGSQHASVSQLCKCVSVCASAYCPTPEVIPPFRSTPVQLAADKNRQ